MFIFWNQLADFECFYKSFLKELEQISNIAIALHLSKFAKFWTDFRVSTFFVPNLDERFNYLDLIGLRTWNPKSIYFIVKSFIFGNIPVIILDYKYKFPNLDEIVVGVDNRLLDRLRLPEWIHCEAFEKCNLLCDEVRIRGQLTLSFF